MINVFKAYGTLKSLEVCSPLKSIAGMAEVGSP